MVARVYLTNGGGAGRLLAPMLLALTALGSAAQAQDVTAWTPPAVPPAGGEQRVDGDGSLLTPPRASDLEPTPRVDDAPRIDPDLLDVSLELPTYRWLPRASQG